MNADQAEACRTTLDVAIRCLGRQRKPLRVIALLHRHRLEYHKPEVFSIKLDERTQMAFIASYEKLFSTIGDDEFAPISEAVRATRAARPVGC